MVFRSILSETKFLSSSPESLQVVQGLNESASAYIVRGAQGVESMGGTLGELPEKYYESIAGAHGFVLVGAFCNEPKVHNEKT